MTKVNQNFTMYAGDTMDITVTIPSKSLTGATIKWAMKKSVSDIAAVPKTTSNGITLTNTSAFTVRLNSADTSGLMGRYYHEAEVTDISGNISTVLTGFITIEPSGV